MRNAFILRPLLILGLIVAYACGDTSDQSEERSPEGQTRPITNSAGYDEMEESYYATDSRVIWQRPELVMSLLGPVEGQTVADIGAGTGYFAFRLAAAGANVIAIDIDPRAISFMESEKERYPEEVQERFTTRQASSDDANLEDEEVDVILMVNTYIYIDDRINYFTKLRDGLKSNGMLVIIDFKKKETTIGPGLDERISLENVRRELTQAGYVIAAVDESTLEYQYLIEAFKP